MQLRHHPNRTARKIPELLRTLSGKKKPSTTPNVAKPCVLGYSRPSRGHHACLGPDHARSTHPTLHPSQTSNISVRLFQRPRFAYLLCFRGVKRKPSFRATVWYPRHCRSRTERGRKLRRRNSTGSGRKFSLGRAHLGDRVRVRSRFSYGTCPWTGIVYAPPFPSVYLVLRGPFQS